MWNRRTALAFAVSLGLHGVALLALLAWPVRAPAPRSARPAPINISILSSPPEPPEPVPDPPVQPPGPTPASPAPKKKVRTPARNAAPPAGEVIQVPPGSAPDTGAAGAPAPEEVASAPSLAPPVQDAPRALKLTPDPLPFATPEPPPPQESRGQTIRNRPEELPDPEAVAAVQAEQAKRRVEGWIHDELATLRVRNGLVDDYFAKLRAGMERAAAHPPAGREGSFLQAMARSWLDSVQSYGRSGNPYAPGAGPEPPLLGGLQTPMGQHAERFPGSPTQQLQQKLEQGARLRDLGDGRFSAGLLAIVELRQSPQGKLLAAALLESSGNKQFDAFVLKSAPAALEALPPPPAQGAGIRPDGIRSTWAFEGRVTYKKKLSEMDLAKDGWYLAGLLPLSLLSGNFDEVTGTVEVIDLRNPEFVCKVRLLKVY